MKLLTFLIVIVGLLLQYVVAEQQTVVMGQQETASTSNLNSEWITERSCRRRVALSVRDFAQESLANTPRPVGYLVSQVGIARWIQSLKIVPDMISKNAELIEANSPPVAKLLKSFGSGSVEHGLKRLIKKVGVVGQDGMTAEKSLNGFFALGGERAQAAYESCIVRGYTGTQLAKQACTTYDTTGEAGLKLYSIKLFTKLMQKSPLGRFAIRYGGLHGLAKRDPKFIRKLSKIISKTRIGKLIKRNGGLPSLLKKVSTGAAGLETVSWNLLGPKILEKVAQCYGGDGYDYVRREKWKGLVTLRKNMKYIDSFPSSKHYTYQFWIKPTDTIKELGSIIYHGNNQVEQAPSVSTCRNGYGLNIRVLTEIGEEGIDCTPPLSVNTCTLVTITNRNGQLRVYYDDKMVQSVVTSPIRTINAPVYFGAPWFTPAKAAVMPVAILTRAMTENEIEYNIAHTHHVCGKSYPKHLIQRFSALLSSAEEEVEENNKASDSSSLLQVNTNVKSKVDANLLNAQEHVCKYRIQSIGVSKFSDALKESPLSDIYSKYHYDLRSFLDAGVTGEINAEQLQSQLSNTKLGTQLASIGGLPKLIDAYRITGEPTVEATTYAWNRVQDLVFQLAGGKLAVALDRCIEQIHIDLDKFEIDKAITTEACTILNNWGRPALAGYGLQLFERALSRSRVGHLYKRYGSITSFAQAMRSNPILESKVGALLYNTEFGKLLSNSIGEKRATIPNVQKGFSSLLSSAMISSDKLMATISDIIGPKITSATASCPKLSSVQQVRSRCRQRVIRQAMEEFYKQLDGSDLKLYLTEAFTASPLNKFGVSYNPSYGIDALSYLSTDKLIEIDSKIKTSKIGQFLLPVGGVSAVARASKAHSEMQQLVWKLYKLRLLPEVDKCVSTISLRSVREAGFVEQCRLRVRDFYMKRFQTEISSSVLGKFVTKFGGFEGMVTHSSDLLSRLSRLVKSQSEQQPYVLSKDKIAVPSINTRIQRVGGLIVVFESVKRDQTMKTFNDLVLDMYGKSAQLALDHCESNAGNAAVASTSQFLKQLRSKLSDPAFKPILNRLLLNAHTPFVRNVLGKEIDAVGGIQGLIAASVSGNNSDLNNYIITRLGGTNMKQTALYPWLESVGLAPGLKRLAQEGTGKTLKQALNNLKCKLIEDTWMNTYYSKHGSCEKYVQFHVQQQTPNPKNGANKSSLLSVGENAMENVLTSVLGEQLDTQLLHGEGQLEEYMSNSMIDVFAAEHAPQSMSAMKDMVTKILTRMKQKKQEITASLLESTEGPVSIEKPQGMQLHLPPKDVHSLPPTVMPKVPTVKKVIHNVPHRCPNQCSGHGKCVQNTAKVVPAPSGKTMLHPYECICDLGWTGTGCEIYIDEFVRFLMSKGAYSLPKCCNVCHSQTHANVDGRFIPAAAALPDGVDDECRKPDWTEKPEIRAKCVKQLLASRQRYVPKPTDKVELQSFMELEADISPFGNHNVLFNNLKKTDTLAQVEAAFEQTLAPKIPNPAQDASFLSSKTTTLYPNSAAAMFPKKTQAEIEAERAKAIQERFIARHGMHMVKKEIPLGSFMSLAVSNNLGLGTNAEEEAGGAPHNEKSPVSNSGQPVEPTMFNGTAEIKYDTSFLHEPQDLSKLEIETCCIPCDNYPDPIKPKAPLRPLTELSIMEQLKRDKNKRLALPTDQGIADAMAVTNILKKEGIPMENPYRRRGPVERTGGFVHKHQDPNYVRRSLRGPLPSEEVKHTDQDNCCNYCPYKPVKGLPWKKPEQPKTIATFLETDAELLYRAQEGMIQFMEEAMELYASPDTSHIPLGHDRGVDGVVTMRPEHPSLSETSSEVAQAQDAFDLEENQRNIWLDKVVREKIDVDAIGDIQSKMNFWWSGLQRNNNITRPEVPDITGIDLSVYGDVKKNAPFLPRPPKKTPSCCNVCKSVFTLRSTPSTPWDDKGSAFELIN